SLVLSIRGQNNPPVVTSMSDDFTDQTAQVRELGLNDKINPTKVTVTVPKGKYEINNLSCNSLDESTGDVSYSRATPSGFSGYVFVAGAKCNCVQN
ncbi:MAG: hypothetical protein V4692_03060, partial [Bdellovibrionota bacterium]